MEAAISTGRRTESARIPIADLHFDDPDEFVDAPLVPGVLNLVTRPRGFQARVRAWRLGGEPYFLYASRDGAALFDESRDYGAVTIPLISSFRIRVGTRHFEVGDGQLQVLAPDVSGELAAAEDAQMLGFAVSWSAFRQHQQALVGPDEATAPVPCAPVSTLSKQGCRLRRYADRLCRDVNGSGSLLHDPRVAQEAVDTIELLLAELLHTATETRREQPDEYVFRRGADFLAEGLDSPVSLSEAAIATGTSTRSLSRAFEKRWGMGPMAFRRRRRFDAAHRDLFFADQTDTSVTDVARRYCFDHLGRFAVQYRELFGESPSETLRG